MRIVSISTVRNECDIIESFVRYTLSYVDRMYIVLAPSSDSSGEILHRLVREGAPVALFHDDAAHHNQENALNMLLQRVNEDGGADFILPLDADEFYMGEGNPRKVFEQLGQDKAYLVFWKTFIPMPDDDASVSFVPKRLRFARNDGHERVHKVIIPGARLPNARLGMGSHSLIGYPKSSYSALPSLRLAHIPVRSRPQMLQKFLVGVLADLSRKDRLPTQNSHWYTGLTEALSPAGLDLSKAALSYACDDNPIGCHPCVIDTSFCPKPYVRYKELIAVNPAREFISAVERLVEKLP